MKYRVSEFAKLVGVSPATLRRWSNEGKLVPERTFGDHRLYDDRHLQIVLNLQPTPKRNIIYCRVSSPSQKNDLSSQVSAMELFALGRGLITETITEIGGGMNFSRPKFMEIIQGIIDGEIGTLIVAHKDRLARFGFELIENIATKNNCEIIVANKESLSPQEEMVEDLMSIVHTFSCRLYGLRKYKKAKDLIDETKP